MNILFVNYGDFTTNSLNHISGFANWLVHNGHACVVAVPDGLDTVRHVPAPHGFTPVTFAALLEARGALFPDGRPADVLHAWTPREGVRRFTLAHQTLSPATRVIIHLEDNEEFLIEAFGGQPAAALRALPRQAFPFPLVDGLSHPVRYRQFLRLADAATVIGDRLREFVPAACPAHLLEPGLDTALYQPTAPDAPLRRSLGLHDEEKVITFTGSVTFANATDVRALYDAVHQLNRDGLPTRLIRTGLTHPDFPRQLGYDPSSFVLELGLRPKAELPGLLALADVLVQPGAPGRFNDYRLPSKLPEFLAMGRPVLLPATNLGLELRDGDDALLLRDGTAAEIVRACRRLFADPALAARLGLNAAAWARRRFDLEANTRALLAFYESILARPTRTDWRALDADLPTELPLLLRQLPAPDADAAEQLADLASSARQFEADLREHTRTIADLQRHAAGLETTRAAREREIADLQLHLDTTRIHHAEHARQLETEIRRVVTESARLQAAATEQLDRLRTELSATHARLAERERQLTSLQAAADRLQQRALGLAALAAQETTRLQNELRESEHRVRRMQATFSWRATAWLRALRRSFVDRFFGPPVQPPLPPPAPRLFRLSPGDLTLLPPAPHFHSALDAPRRWPDEATALTVRGWVVSEEGGPLRAVRARLGSRFAPAEYGLTRPDIGHAYPKIPGAERAGFRLALDLTPDDARIELEAQTADGAWHIFFAQELGAASPHAVRGTYAHWVLECDTLTPAALDALRNRAAALPAPPLISLLVPVYNPPEKWLVRALESVRAQVYRHWELCVADDASTQPHVRSVLERFASEDPRIRLVHRPQNGHISAASNSALALATGEFCALLDHDDELPPHALLLLAERVLQHPSAELVYSDEDKIDETVQRFDPHFKPDWNPDLLTSQNYLSHLTMIRTATLRRVGGFREGFEGAQDWDLFLRVTETVPAATIHHVPHVLYHWRAIDGSTATQLGEKDYATRAARRALEEHFARTATSATPELARGSHWHIVRPRPSPAPLVTLVIPTRNRRELLATCVESIYARTAYPNFEFLIADNDSDDPELFAFYERLRARGNFTVLPCPGPFNYSAINNRAVAHARGEIVGLLNNDLETLHPEWLDELVAHVVRPEIGCVGAKLYFPDRRIQHAGVITGLGGVAGHAFKGFTRDEPGTPQFRPHVVHNVSAVTAACLLVRREVFLRAGGLDETGLAVAFNDADFCLKVEALGLRNLFTPFAELLHHESASRGAEDSQEKIRRFQGEIEVMKQRWGARLLADPAYNPNLTLDAEDFGLAYPPRAPLV